MNGISGVGTSSGYDGYHRSLQGLFTRTRKETGDEETETATEEGIGYGVSSGPMTSPSLLVAVQEAEQDAEQGTSLDSEKTEVIQDDDVVSWIQENFINRIRASARSQALARLGVTEAQLSSLSPDMQAKIEQIVSQAVQAAMVGASGQLGSQGIVA